MSMASPRCEPIVGNPCTPTVNSSIVTTDLATSGHAPWKRCVVCRLRSDGSDTDPGPFRSPRDFCRHLRECHCTREGGSFVCRYGLNGVCPSLPVEGVSDRDYEDHVLRDHVVAAELHTLGSPKSATGSFLVASSVDF
jgi:hypothetical protein